MEDNVFQEVREGDVKIVAFRIPGEKIDLLESLEYLAEYLTMDAVEDASQILLISDQDYQFTDITMIVPKLETKRKDDEELFNELKGSIRTPLDPLVFTTENDILELYRIAIKVNGSQERTDSSIGLDLLKVELPKEGEIVYLIFDDGFRKMSRSEFERMVDESLASLRQGPSLMKDQRANALTKRSQIDEGKGASTPLEEKIQKQATGPGGSGPVGNEQKMASSTPLTSGRKVANDPKVIVRDFARILSAMGYRKDTKFSRSDVHQLFLIGLKGPAIFFKFMKEETELDSFLRVLSHRKDALGVLVTEKWDPRIEAISRINGFIYLERGKARRAPDVIRAVIEEGEDH